MNRIGEVLRHEYIGAVAIGMLLAQAVGIALSLIMRPISFYLERANMPRSAFRGGETEVFPWPSLIGPTINLALLVLISFLLFQWLYLKPSDEAENAGGAESAAGEDESGGTEC